MFITSYYNRLSAVLISGACRSYLCRSVCNVAILNDFNIFKIKDYRKCSLISTSYLICRNMAGHSKWQNIQFIKGERDRQKNLVCTKYVRLVTAAIKEKGPDPKANNKLATILEEAKKNNVPAATLENCLKKASNKKSLKPGTIEILGPGGIFIVLDYETDNICDMRHTLKITCKKHNGVILPGEGGRWRTAFEQKGVIKVISQLNGDGIDGEMVLDAAIEAGAEDVQKMEDGNEYEFLSAPEDLHAVKKELEKKYAIEEAYVGYLPINTVALANEDMERAEIFLNELGDLPDVIRLYENIE